MNTRTLSGRTKGRERGVAAVEFALVAIVFFALLLGILELGRMLYVWNTVQEVTRRAARAATVTDFSNTAAMDAVVRDAIFQAGTSGSVSLPGGSEVSCSSSDCSVQVDYLREDRTEISSLPAGPSDNMIACSQGANNCIRFVRASIVGVTYEPMIAGFFPFFNVALPPSTVVMPAEALGLL